MRGRLGMRLGMALHATEVYRNAYVQSLHDSMLSAHDVMDTAHYALVPVTILFTEEQTTQQVKFAGFGDKLDFQSCVTNSLL